MRHLDLFSGIGGFSLAADMVWENVEHTFVEIDPFCQEVLKKHWPESMIYDDIREFTASNHTDLLTGGFPCQPFSTAGKQKASEDNRYLWPEMLRVIDECKPTWVIGENVVGIVNLALEQVCTDLESKNYEVWPVIIPACAIGAPHRRDRVWILAHTNSNGLHDYPKDRQGGIKRDQHHAQREDEVREFTRRGSSWLQTPSWEQDWPAAITKFCGMDDGVPSKLDKNRIKSLGNAIVPQVAIEIMTAIKDS